MKTTGWVAAAAACLLGAAPAFAADGAPSAREIQTAVDSYLAPASADSTLVGGPGSAGYDGGFWIRGGSFLLKINLTLQTRWEGFDWDDTEFERTPGGDLSGFSLPRVTLKFSGDATCDVHYYAELEFGHAGFVDEFNFPGPITRAGATDRFFSISTIYDSIAEEFGGSFNVDDFDAPAR